jgi:inward rectifier potassium channel
MSKPVSVRAGQTEFLKVNTTGWEWRDAYQWLLGLRWPSFAAFVAGVYIILNFVFAALYLLRTSSIAGMTPGPFADAFFFSVQTLATVGYGHMYPQTLYGHIVTTVEIMSGMFLLAVMTGLIFVRFFRPAARGPLQQIGRDRAIQWPAHINAARRQSASAKHGGSRVPTHVHAR